MIEDETVGWHHRLDEHEFEQAPGIGDRQGSLVGFRLQNCTELDMTKATQQQHPHLLSTDNDRCGLNGLRNFWTVILLSLKYALISQILYSIIRLIKGFLGPSPGLYMWQH